VIDSRQIEAMTGTLIADVFDRAMRTLALADTYTQTGWSVDIYTVASVQAVRLIEAYAALVEGLARFRSGGAQKIVVERVVVAERRGRRGEPRSAKQKPVLAKAS
jgi:hypothetical protein